MAFLIPVVAEIGASLAAAGTAATTAVAGTTAAAGAAGTLGTIGTVAGIGGAVLSGIGAYQQNKSAEAAAKFNAEQGEQAAAAERDAASADAEDRRRAGMAARATSIAARGASGVDIAGTPLLVDENILGQIELDSARTAQRGEVRAIGRLNQASLDKASAKAYGRAAPISAGASLLGGVARSYGSGFGSYS